MQQDNPTEYLEYLYLLASDINAQHSVQQRRTTEAFIRNSYQAAYGASIQHFLPILLALRDAYGAHRAALGLRPAKHSSLFLEQYLEYPIEQTLSQQFLRPIQRDGIVEVGNLAIRERSTIRSLIIAMTAFLCTAKYEWVVFTIGPSLSNSFTRLGLQLTDLGPASPLALPEQERDNWGSYYAQQPRVMAGRLSDAHDFLRQFIIREQALQLLWRQAQHMARASA